MAHKRHLRQLWAAVGYAVLNPNAKVLFLATRFELARNKYKELLRSLPQQLLYQASSAALSLTFPNGSSIQFRTSSDDLRGLSVDAVASETDGVPATLDFQYDVML